MKKQKLVDNAAEYMPLPAELFKGAKDLVMPSYLEDKASVLMCQFVLGMQGITLPSRLEMLGNRDYRILAAFHALDLGNVAVGFDPDYWSLFNRYFFNDDSIPSRRLFLLPYIFSRSMARMSLLVRILFALISIIIIISQTNLVIVNVGRAWMIGTVLSLYVMYNLSLIRWNPDGVMAFCRSMGVPEVEEYMFSYSWKCEEETIRTIAKAIWASGVGVWIDVVKLYFFFFFAKQLEHLEMKFVLL